MRAKTKAVLSLLAMTCGGCAGDGLSAREDYRHNLVSAVYQPSENADTQPTGAALTVASPHSIAVPICVGVVQVGEVAPPQAMLDAFRQDRKLFSLVEPLPGNLDDPAPAATATCDPKSAVSSAAMMKLRKTAAEMGLSYVMVYGGTIDTGRSPSPLVVFDLTIVGYFVVPSEQIWANGKAAGSLIDVSTGRIVLNLGVDAKDSAFLPSEMANNTEPLKNDVRDELVRRMTDQTIARLGDNRTDTASVP
jgi:hypothetical protein